MHQEIGPVLSGVAPMERILNGKLGAPETNENSGQVPAGIPSVVNA